MQRLLGTHTRTVHRFIRYVSVAGSTFVFDLVLLYVLTEYLLIPYYVATFGAFLIAVSINYFISRRLVFRGTARNLGHGYAYFIGLALMGATVTTAGVGILVSTLGLYYLVARILVACVVGVLNYLANLFLNFKVVGLHE